MKWYLIFYSCQTNIWYQYQIGTLLVFSKAYSFHPDFINTHHQPLFQTHSSHPPSSSSQEEETTEGQWATDDIPEFLNAIRRETDAEKRAAEKANAVGTVAVSLAAPPPQNLWAKLQELRLKNPVSGLMEYAQYLGQNCEFLLLDQSGPSHDPRSVTLSVLCQWKLFIDSLFVVIVCVYSY